MKKPKKFKSLNSYLNWYYTFVQKEIILVHRGDAEESWAKRCLYLDGKYQPLCPYNHRSVLDNEIIIEYDSDNVQLNERLVDEVIRKLRKDRISYMKAYSGNKSYHLHVLIKMANVKNVSLLKSTFMRHYGTFYVHNVSGQLYDNLDDAPDSNVTRYVPDLQLSGKHLIRAEFGIHEKTQYTKDIMMKSNDYPSFSIAPKIVWDKYNDAQKTSVKIRMSQQTKDLAESDLVKELLDTVQFKENMDDGRERLVYMLTHVLKHKYKIWEDLADFLWSWYSYSGGRQMDEEKVRNKVKYHFFRSYPDANWERKLRELLDELIGRETLMQAEKQENIDTPV